uniref:transposase n=1 Tax=Arhodomonas sp. AD133 TaxID=3415009 RepID=UPI003EBCCBAA
RMPMPPSNDSLGKNAGTVGKRLTHSATAPVFVIVDGHPAHKAKLVRDYVASTNGQLELHFLPPYAPQLNPDEQVWAHVKRDLGRRGVENLEQMKRIALGALRRIQKLSELVQSFFHHPACRYIIESDITF